MTFPTTGEPSYSLAATILTESLTIAGGAAISPVAMDTLSSAAFGIHVRGMRLAFGAMILIEKHLQGEAFILGRSLFEDSLLMAQLAHEIKDRRSLLLRWQYESLTELENLHKAIAPTGLEDENWKAMPDKIAAARRRLEELATQESIKPKRRLRPIDAATRYGRMHDFWTYQFAHEIVHGSDPAHMLHRTIGSPQTGLPQNVFVSTDMDVPVLATSCANWCARSLLQIAGAASAIFGRDPHEADVAFAHSNLLEEHVYELVNGRLATKQQPPPARP